MSWLQCTLWKFVDSELRVRIWGLEMSVFWKILCTYLMDGLFVIIFASCTKKCSLMRLYFRMSGITLIVMAPDSLLYNFLLKER